MTEQHVGQAPASVRCCIAGCGPAGAMLGLLLARAGVSVLVLEKHGDFLRDFRGDTIHPSTLEILHELGLADRFLTLPHSEVSEVSLQLTADTRVRIDLHSLRGRYPFIAFVPQWDFLDFITQEAARYPTFSLRMNAEVFGLVEERGTIVGARYRDATGEHVARADLTVGADGRTSVTRQAAGLRLAAAAAPMDVLWFRLSRRPGDPDGAALRVRPGHIVAFFDRREYWQVAYLIPKGDDARVRAAGLGPLRLSVAQLVPELADRVDELTDWEQIKLLTVRSDRLRRWARPGFLAIGDAAHAMSPIGGVGINLAIQDAVTAANLLWQPLRQGPVPMRALRRVQRRREPAVRVIQAAQTWIQDRVLGPALTAERATTVPWVVRLLLGIPWLRNVPARVLAYGIARPHVATPALARATRPLSDAA